MEVPDDQSAQLLDGAAPAPPQLPQAGDDHRYGADQQRQSRPPPRRCGGEIRLITPEGPEEGQPVAQAHPGEPAAFRPETAQQHQERGCHERDVGAVRQGRCALAAAEQQCHEQQQAPQQSAAGQQGQTQLKTAPAQWTGGARAICQQTGIESGQGDQGQPSESIVNLAGAPARFPLHEVRRGFSRTRRCGRGRPSPGV